MVITTEAQEKAKDIIRADLDAQFRGKVRFGSIRITPRPGPDEEEYLDVLVVYDGRREDLQAQVLNSLYERIGDDLRVIGIDKNPSISYRDKTEDGEWSEPGTGEPIRAIGMISWQGLIASSRLLITAPDANTPPLPDSIRRSVSTAYYAMFHAQAASNAECRGRHATGRAR